MSNMYVPSISAETVLVKTDPFTLIDIRKSAAALASGQMVAGAEYIDPFALKFDHPLFQEADPLVFYCVHGHEVSMFGCAMARVAGRDAVYVEGGFVALQEAGARLVPFVGEGA